ncbi:MAG: CPBP family intramembrane metalloprotease [Xanthomonadales bacterium]|nr:CPBP family intramembrane metalloprotease [Xanthomonadales bacterium]
MSSLRSLRIKTFFLNYATAYAVVFVSFLIVALGIPLFDKTTSFPLYNTQCKDNQTHTKLLKDIRLALKESESCNLTSPCVETQSLECHQGVQTLGGYIVTPIGYFFDIYNFDDDLIARVSDVLRPEGFFTGFADKSKFLISFDVFLVTVSYITKIIAALAAMFALWRQNLLRETFAFPRSQPQKKLLYPALIAVAFAFMVIFLSSLLSALFPWQTPEGMTMIFDLLGPISLTFLVVVLAPLVEELLFRGVALRFFIEREKQILGSILISIAFAAFHGFIYEALVWQLFASGLYFVLSMTLCWVYIKNKTLWSPIVLHATYNAVLVLVSLLIE